MIIPNVTCYKCGKKETVPPHILPNLQVGDKQICRLCKYKEKNSI